MNSQLTKWAFLAGALYFCCMAVAHYFSIKVPVLFIYYDTPFYAYQDKIISFAVCAYIALFYAASKHRDVALLAIIIIGITALGLASINMSDTLVSVLKPGQSVMPYWLQTVAIAAYFLVLVVCYIKDGASSSK